MMTIKPGLTGARIAGIQTEALAAYVVAASVYLANGENCILTAATDSKHMPGSLHYVGLAIDIGLAPEAKRLTILTALRGALGDDFDVVEEGDHLHLEFQPKRGVNLAV
jgi:hypothetical protein